MYKEYREMSRTEAVDALYQDMAARHRARFRSIHVRWEKLTPFAHGCQILINLLDPAGGGSPEDGRCEATIHEAITDEEPEVPTSSSCCQEGEQEHLRCAPAIDLCLNGCQM